MKRYYQLLGFIVAVILAVGGCGGSGLESGRRLLGQTPPEIASGVTWLGAADVRSLGDLRGKVVLLEFSFLACPPCRAAESNLIRWHEKYAKQGLTIIDIDDGLLDSLAEIRQHIEDERIPFVVIRDTAHGTFANFGITGTPTAYLVDRDGKVIWEGNPYQWSVALEQKIVAALKSSAN